MAGKRKPRKALHEVPVQLPPHVGQLLGDEAAALLDALKQPAPVSIRMNPAKPVASEGERVPWSQYGAYLPERPRFTLDPLFHAGAYYVQEASSMLLEQVVAACGPMREDAVVLDLCAAPGGKSTHLASLIPDGALLIANEVVPGRQAVLAENLWKWGRPNVILAQASPDQFMPLGAFCDLIVLDAPCSGEGMFRKDPHARAQWGENLVKTCAVRQQEIIGQAWAMLKPGGCLIYSTCTWETSENEDQVKRVLEWGGQRVAVPMEEAWNVVATDGGWRCYPHRVRGEGFFISVIRKPGTEGEGAVRPGARPAEEWPAAVRPWLRGAEEAAVLHLDGTLHALDHRWTGLASALAAAVRVTAPGTPVAMSKGGEWLPHPALALSTRCEHGAFNALELDREQALRYLRGEAITAVQASGPALVRHAGHGLGWVQGAGNRWNNRWPTAWRIRMQG